MWRVGTSASSIARELGLTKGKIVGAARIYRWPRRSPPDGARVGTRLPDVPKSAAPTVVEWATPQGGPRSRVGRPPKRREAAEGSRQTSTADRALIEAAIAAGKMKACQPQVAGGVEIRGLQLDAQPLPDRANFCWRRQIDNGAKAAKARPGR